MKKQYFLSIIALITLSLILIKCNKENPNDIYTSENEKIIFRSDSTIQGEVISPNCGIEDYVSGFLCGQEDTITKVLISPNGCNVEVTMNIKKCWDINPTGELYFVFSDLKWKIAQPSSWACDSWWLSLILAQPGQQNELLDEFETYIEQAFEHEYMSEYVILYQLDCQLETASSLFFKSPCNQRCISLPSKEFVPIVSYTTPCADDGCCVQYTSYCLNGDIVWKSGPTTEQISPCTNFIPVLCSDITRPIGGCVDDGCK